MYARVCESSEASQIWSQIGRSRSQVFVSRSRCLMCHRIDVKIRINDLARTANSGLERLLYEAYRYFTSSVCVTELGLHLNRQDSFVGPFTLFEAVPGTCQVHKFKGSSARGLSNPNSTLKVGPKVLQTIRQLPSGSSVLFMSVPPASQLTSSFGAVDLHINHLFALQTGSLDSRAPPEFFADRVFETYGAWLTGPALEACRRSNVDKICASTVIYPIVRDDSLSRILVKYTLEPQLRENSGVSAKEDAEINATPGVRRAQFRIDDLLQMQMSPCTISARRRMVRRFNERLRAFCNTHPEIALVDICDGAVDQDTLEVLPDFICRDPANPHPLFEPTLPLWARELAKAGVRMDWERVLAEAERHGDLDAYHLDKASRLAAAEKTR